MTSDGAVSIARRLQDPLAELVRIDPKAIGVGQYQHDVTRCQLARKLEPSSKTASMPSVPTSTPHRCRCSRGSPASASRSRGTSSRSATSTARSAIRRADPEGAARRRPDIPAGGRLPADQRRRQSARRSAVHPEAYPVVERIVAQTGFGVRELIGSGSVLRALESGGVRRRAQFGVPTVKDILAELDKPGRDPRPEFRTAAFKDGVERIAI